jgi:micrococcal nuclease
MRLLALFLLLCLPAQAETIVGKVVGVTDGDTLTLRTETETLKVRLEAIDTPERGQPFGTKAKQALSELVFGKAVSVESSGPDRYGRTIGTIRAEGVSVNEVTGLDFLYQAI